MAYDAQFSHADELGGRCPGTRIVRFDPMVWFQEPKSNHTIGAGAGSIKRVGSSPVREFSRIRSRFFISQYGLSVFPLHLSGVHDSTFLDRTEIFCSVPQT